MSIASGQLVGERERFQRGAVRALCTKRLAGVRCADGGQHLARSAVGRDARVDHPPAGAGIGILAQMDGVTRDRGLVAVAAQAVGAELDLATVFHARDDFLAGVASLAETDRIDQVQVQVLRDELLAVLGADERNPVFDIPETPQVGARTGSLAAPPQGGCRILGADHQPSGALPGPGNGGVWVGLHFAEGGSGQFNGGFGVVLEVGSGDAEQGKGFRQRFDFDVGAQLEQLQALQHGFVEARRKRDPVLVPACTPDQEVGNHLSLGHAIGGQLGPVVGQGQEVVGELAVQEVGGIGAADGEDGPVVECIDARAGFPGHD